MQQPCSVIRLLKLYPKIDESNRDRVLGARLGPRSVHWQHLPPVFKQQQFVAPLLWKPSQKLTLMLIATACLTGLFLSLRHEVKCVGYWMAKSSQQERQQLRLRHESFGFSAVLECSQWWKVWKAQNSWNTMTAEEQAVINSEAAMAIFKNPPVMKGRKKAHAQDKYEQLHACMCCKSVQGNSKFIQLKRGYPQLVLQKQGVIDDGVIYPSVVVPAHQLVAWLFLGSPPAGHVVCHYDVAPIQAVVQWEVQEPMLPKNRLCFPMLARCLSKRCVCPMCLHFNTQTNNAKSGRDRFQLPERKAKRKRQ